MDQRTRTVTTTPHSIVNIIERTYVFSVRINKHALPIFNAFMIVDVRFKEGPICFDVYTYAMSHKFKIAKEWWGVNEIRLACPSNPK